MSFNLCDKSVSLSSEFSLSSKFLFVSKDFYVAMKHFPLSRNIFTTKFFHKECFHNWLLNELIKSIKYLQWVLSIVVVVDVPAPL